MKDGQRNVDIFNEFLDSNPLSASNLFDAADFLSRLISADIRGFPTAEILHSDDIKPGVMTLMQLEEFIEDGGGRRLDLNELLRGTIKPAGVCFLIVEERTDGKGILVIYELGELLSVRWRHAALNSSGAGFSRPQ